MALGLLRRWATPLFACFAKKSNENDWAQEESIRVDSVELEFPVEFLREAIPLSLQASGDSKDIWKQEIREAARTAVGAQKWATESPVFVTIFYFPDGRMTGDVDNIVKPILDGLMPVIYLDDHQVDRVIVQKFESDRAFKIDNPTPILASVLETEPPVLYIRIDDELSSGIRSNG